MIFDVNAQITLSCQTTTDLLSIPVVMLGFHPRESLVVMVISGGRVKMCARADLTWFATHFGETVASIRNGVQRFHDAHVALIAYSSNITTGAQSALEMLDALGGQVQEMLVTDGDRYWDMLGGDHPWDPGHRWAWDESALAASAVYNGMPVAASREDVVAAVAEPVIDEHLAERMEHAATVVADSDDPLSDLEWLMEADAPLDLDEACRLAVLLQDDEGATAVMSALSAENAEHYRARLMEARRTVAGPASANVVGLLGLACWLDGQGAMAADCLQLVMDLAPHCLPGEMLEFVQSSALPPTWWDRP